MAEPVRIQKALADAGVASRRGADALVAAGRVAVNGRPAVIGQRVDPVVDHIVVDGREVGLGSAPVYLVMSKPAGVTSTVADRHAERTVVELVPPALSGGARIYPVGRLDRDSEGLLLLTNDGEWAQRLLHPRHEVEREYAVGLAEPLARAQHDALGRGIRLEEGMGFVEGLRRATAAEIRSVEQAVGPSRVPVVWYRATLRQGWKRQLRRMFAAVDAPIERLVRVRIGTLRLGGLRRGEVRALTRAERASLSTVMGADAARRAGGTGDPGRAVTDAASPDRAGAAARRGTPPTSERPAAGAAPADDPRRHRTRHDAGLVVSLDGPGSSGKSTVGGAAALEVGYRFCDTGVLYRALTWLALERDVDPDDEPSLVALVPALELVPDDRGRLVHVVVDGVDVTERLRAGGVERSVSAVARHPKVRAALLPVQRALAVGGRIILAGRDIGTVVLPDADLKLYIEVSIEERAARRAAERGVPLEGPDFDEIAAELHRRDGIDSTRATAPLRVPDDAVVIASDGNTLSETVAEVVGAIRAREEALGMGGAPGAKGRAARTGAR